jgi:hypothetical protein
MRNHTQLTYGPEYLDHLADRIGRDHPEDAIPLRQAAQNWREDQKEREQAQSDASVLQGRVNRIAAVAREEAPCN